jgi:ketosteroid isomerase-like protein
MTENKKTIEKYMEGFRKGDHAMVLSCLTDDVVWDLPGYFHWVGKEAFDKEIENPAFKGRPEIEIVRMVEEGETLVATDTQNVWDRYDIYASSMRRYPDLGLMALFRDYSNIAIYRLEREVTDASQIIIGSRYQP